MAGAVLNHSRSVVGITNVFAVDHDLEGAWSGVLASAVSRFPGMPTVGDEHGDQLAAALRNGCTRIAAPRIWHHSPNPDWRQPCGTLRR